MTPPARGSRLGALLAAAGVLAISLAATEVVLRCAAPIHLTGIQAAYRWDAETGVSVREGVHAFKLTDHQEEVRTNHLGTVNFQEDFSGYAERVFAVGDSFTQGTGLPADASYPAQLDLELNLGADGLYAPRVAVVNLGLAAFGPEQALLTLRRFVERLGAPAAVLFLGAENDADDDTLFRAGYVHQHIVYGSPTWGPFAGLLIWASDFEVTKRAKLAVSTLRRAAIFRADHALPAPESAARAPVAERTWPVIERMAGFARERGAHFVVSWSDPRSPSYDWLRARAERAGLAFADWKPAAESVRAAVPALPLDNPHSGGHLRPWVNRLIAKAFAAELRGHVQALRSVPAAKAAK